MTTTPDESNLQLITKLVPHISCNDKEKIGRLLWNLYHPHSVDDKDISNLFDRIALVFWSKYSGAEICSFCREPAWHYNEPANMYACASCMLDLENGEIDIFHPDDHPISIKLFNIIKEWVDTNHWAAAGSDVYFDEYGINCNYCHVCRNIIENIPNTYVAMATGGGAVAHYECAEREGFREHFTDYEDICEMLEIPELIENLGGTPYYTPEILPTDTQILVNIMKEVGNQLDCSTPRDLLIYLHPKYWVPIKECRGCAFCQWQCTHYNEHLGLLGCKKCLDCIPAINLISPYHCNVSKFLVRKIQEWVRKEYFLIIEARSLFDNYGFTYNRCMVCKDIIDIDSSVAVTDCHVAHYNCFQSENNRYRLHTNINSVLGLPQFGLQELLASLTTQ